MESNESNSSHKVRRSTKYPKSDTVVPQVGTGDHTFSSHSSEKRMKKDDSGIDVSKLECDDVSDEDISDEDISDNSSKNTKQMSDVNNVKVSNELNSPDSGNQESCSSSEFQDSQNPEANQQHANTVPSEDNAMPNEDKNECDKEIKDKNECNSNTHIDSENEKNETDKAKAEDDWNKYDPTPKTPLPKHKWMATKVYLDRLYGSSVRYSPHLFRYNCYGGLHMIERLELMYKMRKHDGCVNALHFNTSGTKLASGSDDLDIIIWDWTTSEPILEYDSGHRSNVFQAKFIPLSGDCLVASCARDGQVRVAELSSTGTCRSTRKLAQHKGAAHKLAIQMDSPHTFLTCGEDAAVFEIDLREGKPEKLLVCKENDKKVPLYSIFINPYKSHEYTVGGRDHFVRVYDKRCVRQEDSCLKKFCPHHLLGSDTRANVTSVVYNYNGTEILASLNDEDIYVFDTSASDTSQYLHRYKGHRNSQTVKGVNYFGTKSEYIISGSDCGYIFFWEKESEHIVKYMHGDEGGVVNCLEPNPNMPVLATSGLDDDIKIWVPSREDIPDTSGLKEHIISNMKEREEDRRQEGPDAFDDQMIWFLMENLRRARHRSQSNNGNENLSSSSSTSDSESHDDESEFHHTIQCNQS